MRHFKGKGFHLTARISNIALNIIISSDHVTTIILIITTGAKGEFHFLHTDNVIDFTSPIELQLLFEQMFCNLIRKRVQI